MKALVYILYSISADKYYIGHTTEPIEERIRKHNSGHKGFTGKFRDWKVVYYHEYESKGLSFRREFELKSWKSRSRIEKLISGSEHQPGCSEQAGREGRHIQYLENLLRQELLLFDY